MAERFMLDFNDFMRRNRPRVGMRRIRCRNFIAFLEDMVGAVYVHPSPGRLRAIRRVRRLNTSSSTVWQSAWPSIRARLVLRRRQARRQARRLRRRQMRLARRRHAHRHHHHVHHHRQHIRLPSSSTPSPSTTSPSTPPPSTSSSVRDTPNPLTGSDLPRQSAAATLAAAAAVSTATAMRTLGASRPSAHPASSSTTSRSVEATLSNAALPTIQDSDPLESSESRLPSDYVESMERARAAAAATSTSQTQTRPQPADSRLLEQYQHLRRPSHLLAIRRSDALRRLNARSRTAMHRERSANLARSTMMVVDIASADAEETAALAAPPATTEDPQPQPANANEDESNNAEAGERRVDFDNFPDIIDS